MTNPAPTAYAAAHKTCGHVAVIVRTRHAADDARFLLGVIAGGQGVNAWLVREANDEDIASVAAGLCCDQCRVSIGSR